MRIVKVTLWSVLLLALTHVQAAERLGKVEFKEATVKDAVRVISELSRSDVVATEAAANKSVSLYLKNSTVESAIDSLCRVTGLWYRHNDEFNTYYIMTQEEFGKDVIIEKQAQTRVFELKHQNVSDAAYAIQSLFGTRVKLSEPQENNSYTLDGDLGGGGSGTNSGSNNTGNANNSRNNNNLQNNTNNNGASGGQANVKDITRSLLELADFRDGQKVSVDENSLSSQGQRHESTIYVTWNYLHNLLVVRASDKRAIADIAKLVERLDQPAQQVLLEMKILQATLGDEQRSIFDVSYNNGRIRTGTDSNGNPVYQPKTQIDVGNFPTEGGAFLTRLLTSKVSATIEFLSTQNRVDLLAQPNLLSANNKEATLTIGEDRLLVTGASSDVVVNENTTFINIEMETRSQNIGTTLSIWPRINGDNTVTLDIEQSNTSLNEDSQSIAISDGTGGVNNVLIDSVTESTIELTAIARHGETIALGGMIQVDKQDVQEKVPLLGDLPLIGALFRKEYTTDTRRELVILITPHISHDPNQAASLHDGIIKSWAELIEDDRYINPDDQVSRTETRHWSKDIQRRAVRLIQAAANGQCGEFVQRPPRFTRWAINSALYLNPEFHCQDNDLYLTAASLNNRKRREARVQASLFDQGWVASSGENQLLGATDSGRIYLVSVGQPDALLQRHKQNFRLTEEALLND